MRSAPRSGSSAGGAKFGAYGPLLRSAPRSGSSAGELCTVQSWSLPTSTSSAASTAKLESSFQIEKIGRAVVHLLSHFTLHPARRTAQSSVGRAVVHLLSHFTPVPASPFAATGQTRLCERLLRIGPSQAGMAASRRCRRLRNRLGRSNSTPDTYRFGCLGGASLNNRGE